MTYKIGPHYMNGGEDTTSEFLKLNIAAIKFAQLDLDVLNNNNPADPFDQNTTMGLLRTAKSRGIKIIGRRIEELPDLSTGSIDSLVNDYLGKRWAANSFAELVYAFPQVDYWEGPNEYQVGDDEGMMIRYSEFLAKFAARVRTDLGKWAVLGNWSVGTPDFPLWKHYGPVLQAVRSGYGVLGRHCYGYIDSVDGPYYGLRHRLDEIEFRKLGFTNTPVLLTECGLDSIWKNGTLTLGPWKKLYPPEDIHKYWNEYLRPAMNEYEKDPYVLAVFPFTFGNGQSPAWTSYDHAHLPLANELISNPPIVGETVPEPPPPQPPPPPAGGTHWVKPSGLNVRLFPWSGSTVPPIQRVLRRGDLVTSLATIKFGTMSVGWNLISPNGNEWVNSSYLAPVSEPIVDEPAVG